MANWQEIDQNDDETIDSEACSRLLHCERTTVEEWARAGRLPGIKFGKSWLFHREQVLDSMKDRALEEAEQRGLAVKPNAIAVAPAKRGRALPEWQLRLLRQAEHVSKKDKPDGVK